jgi:hypothetical protein
VSSAQGAPPGEDAELLRSVLYTSRKMRSALFHIKRDTTLSTCRLCQVKSGALDPTTLSRMHESKTHPAVAGEPRRAGESYELIPRLPKCAR